MEHLRFEKLDLCPELLRAVEDMGFEEMTPIQAQSIPVMSFTQLKPQVW